MDIVTLKVKGLLLQELYQITKESYETAQRIESEVETIAIRNLNYIDPETNLLYTKSYKFVQNEDMFAKYLEETKKVYRTNYNIDINLNEVYSYNFLKDYLKAKKDYLMFAVEFLRANEKEAEATEIEKVINTYIPPKFEERLINLNNDFLKVKI